MILNLKTYFTKSLVVLLVLLAIPSCNSDKKENDWDKNNLKGKVKSITEISYEAKDRFGKIEKVSRKRKYDIYDYQKKFNNEGYLIEKKEFNSDDRLKFIIKYDDIGNPIEGNEHISDGSFLKRYINIYNDKGVVIEHNNYNSVGKIESKFTFKYDKRGNKIETNEYNSDGNIETKYIYKYDDKGNKVEKKKYNLDGILEKKYIFKYDDKGNLLEETFYSEDLEKITKYDYQYDDIGNKIISKNYLYENFSYKVVDIYDNKGNEIEAIFYDEYEVITSHYTYEYEFDEQKNWIKKIEFKNQTPTYLLEREIVYFE